MTVEQIVGLLAALGVSNVITYYLTSRGPRRTMRKGLLDKLIAIDEELQGSNPDRTAHVNKMLNELYSMAYEAQVQGYRVTYIDATKVSVRLLDLQLSTEDLNDAREIYNSCYAAMLGAVQNPTRNRVFQSLFGSLDAMLEDLRTLEEKYGPQKTGD